MNAKRFLLILLAVALATGLLFAAMELLGGRQEPDDASAAPAVTIQLADRGITVDGEPASTNTSAAVYTANDIVYYEEGKDFTYGEGTEADAHTAEEADAHSVVHITQPGTYVLSGHLSAGQIAVDLGEDAEDDPNAVVTLVLNGMDISCTVAPAIIFYNVYECGNKDTPTKDVDTSAAGANVIIADGTANYVNGSYVARIYKPDTVELTEDGTEVSEAKKLHKYDAAFYSMMTMNVNGDTADTGILNITAENEGLDSELHLTINGGNINISSGNDGINTNEDGVSVTTVNGGTLTINVTGETGEGDGIDSNGWLVINGGTVITAACSNSADAGIDSDMGICINGGTVFATGHMLDRIEASGQNYAVFSFAQPQIGSDIISLKNSADEELMAQSPMDHSFSILIYSSPELAAGEYTLWRNGLQLSHSGVNFGGGGMGGDMMPRPEAGMPESMAPPEGMEFPPEAMTPPDGEMPQRPEDFEMPDGMEPPRINEGDTTILPNGTTMAPGRTEQPDGGFGGRGPGIKGEQTGKPNTAFAIANGGNRFSGITLTE